MVSIAQRRELQDKLDPILYLCYDYILIISDNRVLATHGGSISLISFDANMLFTSDVIYVPQYPVGISQYDDESAPEADMEYLDDMPIYVKDGKEGVIDYDGNILIEAQYSSIEFISETQMEIFP